MTTSFVSNRSAASTDAACVLRASPLRTTVLIFWSPNSFLVPWTVRKECRISGDWLSAIFPKTNWCCSDAIQSHLPSSESCAKNSVLMALSSDSGKASHLNVKNSFQVLKHVMFIVLVVLLGTRSCLSRAVSLRLSILESLW